MFSQSSRFVICERSRFSVWLADPPSRAPRPAKRLKGFSAHVIENWIWDSDRPWIAVTLSGSLTDEVAVDSFSLAEISAQHRPHVERLLSPQTPAFSAQPTRLGTIVLLDAKQLQQSPLSLIPLRTGDPDSELPDVSRRVAMKRLCCQDFASFSAAFSVPAVASDSEFDAAAEALVSRVQSHLVVLNYLRGAAFVPGRIDSPTMLAVARCRAEMSLLESHGSSPSEGAAPDPGFLTPGVASFLARSVDSLRAACTRLGIKARFLDASEPSSILGAAPDVVSEWSLCLVSGCLTHAHSSRPDMRLSLLSSPPPTPRLLSESFRKRASSAAFSQSL